MLSKKNRLTTNSSFKATYFKNRVASDEFFVLFAGKNKADESDNTKIGFVVSKKIDKRAVVRNKIKRRLREASAAYLKEKNIPFVSLVFKAKINSTEADYNQTLRSVYRLIDMLANKFI